MGENTSSEPLSPVVKLGQFIRTARKRQGLTMAQLADQIGRPREWLNRVELGYSEYGEYKPASQADIQTIYDLLESNFTVSLSRLLELGKLAEEQFYKGKLSQSSTRRAVSGKLTQTEVIVGEKQIVRAIIDLINEQHSDAIIRNTGIKGNGNNPNVTENWKAYRNELGSFLTQNPNAIFKRVEYAASSSHLAVAKETDIRVAGSRRNEDVHNAKIKFHKQNPMQLHVLIGQREALIALPHTSGQVGSNMALLIRDKIFVEALRVWYDEVLWDAPGISKTIDFTKYDESFEEIKQMYGYNEQN